MNRRAFPYAQGRGAYLTTMVAEAERYTGAVCKGSGLLAETRLFFGPGIRVSVASLPKKQLKNWRVIFYRDVDRAILKGHRDPNGQDDNDEGKSFFENISLTVALVQTLHRRESLL